MEIGGAIKALRQEQGLSLDLLAGRSGVSRAMLSEIERGLKNPTVRIVIQIAGALGTTVAALLGESPAVASLAAPAPSVIRRAERPTLVEPQSGAMRQSLSSTYAAYGVETLWYTLPPAQETTALPAARAGAVAQIVVFWGRLICALAAGQVVLDEGDSVFFPDGLPLSLRNPDAAPCEFLLISDSRTTVVEKRATADA